MTDVMDEIEAMALEVAQCRDAETKDEEFAKNATPLVKVFRERGIRILGTVEDPYFCAVDVAVYIDDKGHYHRKIAKYTIGEYLQMLEATTIQGQMRQMQFLTEAGLYKYLLQSKGEKAEEFQRFVYKLLKDERKRTVDSIQLAMKIAQTKVDELQKAKSALERKQSQLYTAANKAKQEVLALTKENKTLRKSRADAADAEEMRLCGRQIEQIPGWNC